MRAVREGAQDYLVKGQVTSRVLVRAMRYATERKRAIEELQRSEEYFRSLIENALDIITVLDDKGIVRYGSPSIERVLGYQASALIGTNLLAIIHPDDRRIVIEKLVIGAETPGLTQEFQCRLLHRDGTWRVLEAIGKGSDRKSTVGGFVLNSRDITERKRAEEALREANQTLRAVIETSPLAIFSLDLRGHVKSWNRTAEAIFGYSAAEVIDEPLPIIFPEDQADFHHSLELAIKGHLQEGTEGRFRRKDGSAIEVSRWNAQLRDGKGLITGIFAAVADNT